MKGILLVFIFFLSIPSTAQHFREVQLPTPDQLRPLFVGSIFKSTLHYGATPPNYNGKVIVFNYGYLDLDQTQFLFDNSYYKETYNEGYQAVFVATTRGGGIWINGALLANAIDIITAKFEVPEVYIIAHSNGGKAAEAAMFHYDKNDKVKRVFTLGTPFRGTYLANISQMPWLNWAWRLTGLNEGAFTSTTYYCNSVVRPYFDRLPQNEPEKFVTFGASGYYNGSNPLSPAFAITGAIVFPRQGANDGIGAYSSTIRPGSEVVFGPNDSRAIFDHLDIGLGQFTWPYIKDYLDNPDTQRKPVPAPKQHNTTVVESNYYLIRSENSYDALHFDKDTDYALAEIIHETPKANFMLYDHTQHRAQKQLPIPQTKKHLTKLPLHKTGNETVTQLKSSSKFVAFVKQSNTLKMTLTIPNLQENPKINVTFSKNNHMMTATNAIDVHGVLTRTDPNGNTSTVVVDFERHKNKYSFDTSNLATGVYSLYLQGARKGEFKRSIISGFAIGSPERLTPSTTALSTPAITKEKQIQLFPSVIKNSALLSINTPTNDNTIELTLFDSNGRTVKRFDLPKNTSNNYPIGNQIQGLQSGIYFLKVNNYNTLKFLKQ